MLVLPKLSHEWSSNDGRINHLSQGWQENLRSWLRDHAIYAGRRARNYFQRCVAKTTPRLRLTSGRNPSYLVTWDFAAEDGEKRSMFFLTKRWLLQKKSHLEPRPAVPRHDQGSKKSRDNAPGSNEKSSFTMLKGLGVGWNWMWILHLRIPISIEFKKNPWKTIGKRCVHRFFPKFLCPHGSPGGVLNGDLMDGIQTWQTWFCLNRPFKLLKQRPQMWKNTSRRSMVSNPWNPWRLVECLELTGHLDGTIRSPGGNDPIKGDDQRYNSINNITVGECWWTCIPIDVDDMRIHSITPDQQILKQMFSGITNFSRKFLCASHSETWIRTIVADIWVSIPYL